jgi:hypothetical protein
MRQLRGRRHSAAPFDADISDFERVHNPVGVPVDWNPYGVLVLGAEIDLRDVRTTVTSGRADAPAPRTQRPPQSRRQATAIGRSTRTNHPLAAVILPPQPHRSPGLVHRSNRSGWRSSLRTLAGSAGSAAHRRLWRPVALTTALTPAGRWRSKRPHARYCEGRKDHGTSQFAEAPGLERLPSPSSCSVDAHRRWTSAPGS